MRDSKLLDNLQICNKKTVKYPHLLNIIDNERIIRIDIILIEN
jgi:hypothetical protein